MLQRYLDLLQSSFEKLTSLGGGNNTWADYFSAVGGEFLVLGIGLLYLAAIFLLFFIPVGGNYLFVKKIRKNDIYFRCLEIYRNKYHRVACKLQDIINDNDKDMSKAKEKLLNDEIIELFKSVGITKYDDFRGNGKDILKSLEDAMAEFNMDNDTRVGLSWRYNYGNSWCQEICEHNWTNCGVFSEFSKLTKNSFRKAVTKIACGITGITIVYLIFAVPLVMMLFK